MSQLKFATKHVIWTEEQWDCIPFSDKSKFNLFGFDGRRFVWRSPKERYSPQCTKSSVKFGEGRVMVFGMISVASTGLLVRLQNRINTTVQKEILKKHTVPNLRTQLINQLYLCKIRLRVTPRNLLKHFFQRKMLLLWNG